MERKKTSFMSNQKIIPFNWYMKFRPNKSNIYSSLEACIPFKRYICQKHQNKPSLLSYCQGQMSNNLVVEVFRFSSESSKSKHF